jgi:NifU-like protein involved in Fe-S cluster formation
MEENKMAFKDVVNKYSGRLDNPDASESVTGPRGDTLEFDISFKAGKVEDIRFRAAGCMFTSACAAIAAFYAHGRTPQEALFISPGLILKTLVEVPEDHRHSAVLAATTLYRTVIAIDGKTGGLQEKAPDPRPGR